MFLRPLLAAVSLLALASVAGVTAGAPAGSAATANKVTPGNFRGYGFDQCLAPTQKAMNTWLKHSPYLAVGIYISGASRACRVQPNLTPTWISTQLEKGWRLLPITLGPQAPCNPRFPRYGNDPVIKSDPGSAGKFGKARKQGAAEAQKTVTAAEKLGIAEGSTLWYDLEGFDQTNLRCRRASLAFLSGWTRGLHDLHFVSGVYSSAGSGIWALDDARVNHPTEYRLPDRIWIARWDGKANTSTSYIRDDGWRPGNRMKQYLGGHNETWGGVTINIDRNYLNLGTIGARAESHCGGVDVDLPDYPRAQDGSDPGLVKTLQCLLLEQKTYAGKVNGRFSAKTLAAVNAWQEAHGLRSRPYFTRRAWMTLLSTGPQPVLKRGSTGPAVRRVQRTLNAASRGTELAVSGVFDQTTDRAVRAWQKAAEVAVEGVVNPKTWGGLTAGARP
ncbi:MAG TPA: glycoside hydrolase domain-containing protein [Nocardioides sp.]|jgi:peptidoglycan hydrolase-like protein with peptidoglycan-binding domain|nr:glycoside hydrolase domain-containing protein [Nocardioides sp.]